MGEGDGSGSARRPDAFGEAITLPALEETADGASVGEPRGAGADDEGDKSTLETRVEASSDPVALGRYLVLGTLGRGGMGTVFTAFDPQLDRRVALKVLHRGVDALQTARLLREAQALAKLSHPNVVQVYEVGKVEGQAFVAMELLEGQTLKEWLAQEPRPGWPECVQVFVQVGAGLAAAHEQGLVHRDFKPGNAILDSKGRARVLDFGLARQQGELDEDLEASSFAGPGTRPGTRPGPRMTERDSRALDTALTNTGAVLGTPAYMPPEQMKGVEVDARSDQFSFCVALYEAVYGERPYPGTTVATLMVSMTRGTLAQVPRGARVPARLRRALLRGLAIPPEQRWPSMEALLAELRALVEPRGRRVLGIGIGAGLLAVGVGLALGSYTDLMQRCTGARIQLVGIWDDARRQQIHDAILGTERPFASSTWERVERRLDEYADAWIERHVEVCEATAVRHEQSADAMDLRMGCLSDHRSTLRAVIDVLARADDKVVEKAVSMVAGLPRLTLCDDVERLQALRQRVPPPEDPATAQRVQALREELESIEAELAAGRYAEALGRVEPAMEQAEALGYGPLVAEARWLRGWLRERNGHYPEAERDLTQAYAQAVRHDHETLMLEAASQLVYVVGFAQARPAEGLLWGHTVLPLAERIGDASVLAMSENSLGSIRLKQGKYEQAEAHYRRALEIQEQAMGGDDPGMAAVVTNLGNVLFVQGEYEEAEALHRRALGIRERALGGEHPDVALSVGSLGQVLYRQGKLEEAQAQLRRALEIRERALGAEHPYVAASVSSLGNVLLSQGDYAEAEAQHRRALEIRERVLGAEHPDLARSLNNLGLVLDARGQYGEAEARFRRALGIVEQALGSEHPDVALSVNNLGGTLFHQGQVEQAGVLYRRALEIRERALGPEHPLVAYPLVGLARVGLAMGEPDVAREHAERAVSIRESGTISPDVLAEARFELARALWSDPPQRTRARALAEQARDAYAEASPGRDEARADVEAWLSEHPRP